MEGTAQAQHSARVTVNYGRGPAVNKPSATLPVLMEGAVPCLDNAAVPQDGGETHAHRVSVIKSVLMEGVALDPISAVALRNGVDTTALKLSVIQSVLMEGLALDPMNACVSKGGREREIGACMVGYHKNIETPYSVILYFSCVSSRLC